MKKPRSSRPKKSASFRGWKKPAHRTTTFKSNGGLPESREVAPDSPEQLTIGEAMRRAVQELGEVQISTDTAAQHLRELSDCYENVARAQAAYNLKAEAAKTAKKSFDSATELLLEKVRAFTHPVPLPLFDQKQAEADQADMLDAAKESGAPASL